MIKTMRDYFDELDFIDVETPMLGRSTPEGARDYLVPSRVQPGTFYALPQSPQLYKQILMIAGYDRYVQVARCFRDEDLRADRQPEFTQLDIEMSFVEERDVQDLAETMIRDVFRDTLDVELPQPFPRMSWRDALDRYGSDKPDLRNPIKMQDVSEHFRGSGFAIFAKLLEQDGTEIRAIPAKGGGSRKFCDRMNSFAQKEGLPGMGYIFWRDGADGMEAAGPLAKNIGPERTEAIRQQLGLGVGDAAFFLGGKPHSFEAVAGRARNVIGEELNLTEQNRFAFAWIVDFPIYEKDEETGEILIAGMGELHLEIIVDRMKREFKVEANVGAPQVSYRETIRMPTENVEGRFVRQTGGRGQYGHVVINVFYEPLREFFDLEGLWADAKRITTRASK